jgi:hypothetical protein
LTAVVIKSLPARRRIKANMNKIQREAPAPSPGFLVDNQSLFLHAPQSSQRAAPFAPAEGSAVAQQSHRASASKTVRTAAATKQSVTPSAFSSVHMK